MAYFYIQQPKTLPRSLPFTLGENGDTEITQLVPDCSYLGGDSSPQFSNQYQDVAGQDGSRFNAMNISKMTFTANFYLQNADYDAYRANKHAIYSLFGQRELLRIRTSEDPAKVMYCRPTSFDIKPISDSDVNSKFSITFEVPSGVKQSLKRSDQLTADDISFGMGLPANERLNYTFTESHFQVFNASDLAIDPYYQRHDMRILLNYTGANCTITNHTNGSSITINKQSSGNDQVAINGVNTTINNASANGATDFGYIKLERGYNDIEVTGTDSRLITFSFPFIYLD